MMTKTKRIIYFILMFLPLIVTTIAMIFLPDSVPMHYGANNQVDRLGSKFELFILPCVVVAFGLFFLILSKVLNKVEEYGSNNKNICQTLGIVFCALFNILTYFFIYTAIKGVNNLNDLPIDSNSMIVLLLGIVMIIIGNIIPKAKMNSMLGLRTKWSMSSEEVWKKSQRFGGYSLVLTGVLMIIISIFTEGSICMILGFMSLFITAIIASMYSYFASK